MSGNVLYFPGAGADEDALLICCGALVKDEAAIGGLLEALIADANAEAGRQGWPGIAFRYFASHDGHVSFQAACGAAPATLEDLRRFREAQKLRLAQEEQDQPAQGSLI